MLYSNHISILILILICNHSRRRAEGPGERGLVYKGISLIPIKWRSLILIKGKSLIKGNPL